MCSIALSLSEVAERLGIDVPHLRRRMTALGIKEADLNETAVGLLFRYKAGNRAPVVKPKKEKVYFALPEKPGHQRTAAPAPRPSAPERVPVGKLAEHLCISDDAVRWRMTKLGISARGGITREEAKRVIEFSYRRHNANLVLTAPGSICVCGELLTPGQRVWFCSDACRADAQLLCCETLAGLIASGHLSRRKVAA